MGKIDRSILWPGKRSKPTPIDEPEEDDDSFWGDIKDVGSAALRYMDRAARLAGLAVGTGVGALGSPPGVKLPWLPDMSRLPEAAGAFWENVQEGDWDAAIEAYQDELDAGRGFWGAAEIGGAFIPTGGPALAGARLLSAAPKLAGTLARVAPVAARPGAARGIETGVRGAGKVLRAPWELEEAAGRLAAKGVGKVAGPVVGPLARPLVSRFRRPGVEAVEKVAEEAPIDLAPPPITPARSMIGDYRARYSQDNPLVGAREEADPEMIADATEWIQANPRTQTARVDNASVRTSDVIDVPGQRGEEAWTGAARIQQIRRIDDIARNMRERGFDPDKPIAIDVEQDGRVLIYEGNKRVRAAQIAGIENIPAEVRYYGGSEELAGLGAWTPSRLMGAPTTAARVGPGAVPRAIGDIPTIGGAAYPEPTGITGFPKVLPQLQPMVEAIAIATRENVGRRIANLPVIGGIQKRLNPAAVRNTVEGRGLTGLAILRFEAKQKADQIMADLHMLGTQEQALGKVDDLGLFMEGPLKGLAPNDVRMDWEKPYINRRLTEPMKQWIRTAQGLEEAKLQFLKANDIPIKELSFTEGGHYAGRRVMGRFDDNGRLIDAKFVKGRRGPGKMTQQQTREFVTQEEAIREKLRYLPEDEALHLNMQAAYERVAKKNFAEWMIANSPNIRMLGKRGKKRQGEYGISDYAPDFNKAVFTGPDAAEIAELMKRELGTLQNLPGYATKLGQVNAVGRFMTLNADASPFLIQLLYMTGARGGLHAWGNAITGFAKTLGSKTYHDNLIAKHQGLLARHRGLITSQGGTEYTEAIQRGGLLTKGPKWAPWRGVAWLFTPFGRAFNTAMDEAGIQLAKSMDLALKPKTAAEIADIDAFINEIRGLASSTRLGVSPGMQAVESSLLLAPRYNRAIAALLWDTFFDGGLRGYEATRALVISLTGLTTLAAGLSIAEYLRETDEPTQEGLQKAVKDHIDPRSPTFFTWKVGNSNVGPGTKVRSLIKLAANSYKDPRSLLEISQENPWTRFARGNLAPVLSDTWDIFSGHNYMGDPTGFYDGWTEDSVGDNFVKLGTKVILPDIMPIWTQAVLLEGGTPGERGVRGVAEFAGGRAYPLSRTQLGEQVAAELGYGDYDTLSFSKRAEIDKVLTERHGERGYTGAKGPWYEKKDKANDMLLRDLEAAATKHLSASPDKLAFSPALAGDALKKAERLRRNKLYGAVWDEDKQRTTGGIYEQIYDMDEEREEPELGTIEHRLWEYRSIVPRATDSKGQIDWVLYDKYFSEFWSGLKQNELNEVLENIRVLEGDYPEKMQTVVEARRYAGALRINGISYWDIEKLDEVRQYVAKQAGVEKWEVDDYMDALNGRRREEMRGAEPDVYKKIEKVLREERKTDDGFLASKKIEWMNQAPKEWFLAMHLAAYDFVLDEKIREFFEKTGDWKTILEQPYEWLYRGALIAAG